MQQGILSPREAARRVRLPGASARSGRAPGRRRRPPRTAPAGWSAGPAPGAARPRAPSRARASGGARRDVPPGETPPRRRPPRRPPPTAASASAPSPHPAQRTLAGPRGGKAPSPSRARRNSPAGLDPRASAPAVAEAAAAARVAAFAASTRSVLDLPEELEREVELGLRNPPEAAQGRNEAPRSGEPALSRRGPRPGPRRTRESLREDSPVRYDLPEVPHENSHAPRPRAATPPSSSPSPRRRRARPPPRRSSTRSRRRR